jgi:hypothetical protein
MNEMDRYSTPQLTTSQTENVTGMVGLEAEYRTTRAALVNAGVDMTDSMDALYRDWRRWRAKAKSQVPVDRVGLEGVDQWWARHLAQFRRLIDPHHVMARAARVRKDQSAVRTRPHLGRSGSLTSSATLAKFGFRFMSVASLS